MKTKRAITVRAKSITTHRTVELANRSRFVRLNQAAVSALFSKVDALPLSKKAPLGVLSIAVVDNMEIASVHGAFFNDPTPTDVITIPGDGTVDNAGEIIISAERALELADRRRLDPLKEMALYLVHGWLHLAGYDDLSPTTRRQMRTMERKVFGSLDDNLWKKLGKIK